MLYKNKKISSGSKQSPITNFIASAQLSYFIECYRNFFKNKINVRVWKVRITVTIKLILVFQNPKHGQWI